MIKRIFRVGLWLLILLLVVTAILLGGRILIPPQMEDDDHLRLKQEYLAKVAAAAIDAPTSPNLVVILFDDLGYGDLSVYGSRAVDTPNIDRIAAAGLRFTNAYSPSPYCSASRAGLLTGRHPTRMGLDHVLQPAGTWQDTLLRIGARNRQLPAEEITLPEVLSAVGYATGMVGKWHLGDASPSLPNDRGFDSYFGLLYSNDQGQPALWRDRQIIEPHPLDQSSLTHRYTKEAVAFLEVNRDRPFFLYMPHTFPHVPLFASDPFRGRSDGGLYGDVIEELDSSVGTVMATLTRLGLADQTLVLITSDNGPWFQGSPGGTRGRKMDVFEGGMRVPFILHWPGHIAPAQVSELLASGLDLFPTFLEMASLPLPRDRDYDGVSLVPLFAGGSPELDRSILFTQIRKFQAIREERFKYHARHGVLYGNPMDWRWGPFILRGPWLFDLDVDPHESYDISGSHPAVAERLAGKLGERQLAWNENPRGWIDPD